MAGRPAGGFRVDAPDRKGRQRKTRQANLPRYRFTLATVDGYWSLSANSATRCLSRYIRVPSPKIFLPDLSKMKLDGT